MSTPDSAAQRSVRITRQPDEGTVLLYNDAGESIRITEHEFDLYIATLNEAAVRADERRKLADLLEEHAKMLGDFAKDGWALIGFIVWLLRLNGDPWGGAEHPDG